MEIAQVTYYTDSKVVLGYITNESKRFYVYVANRVQLIRSLSSPDPGADLGVVKSVARLK